jgi:cation transport ATPase
MTYLFCDKYLGFNWRVISGCQTSGFVVWVGTINLNGVNGVSVRTTALAEDCVVAKMAKLVEEAQNSKSKTQRFIDKSAQYYTPG